MIATKQTALIALARTQERIRKIKLLQLSAVEQQFYGRTGMYVIEKSCVLQLEKIVGRYLDDKN